MKINEVFKYLKGLGVLFEVNDGSVNLRLPKNLDSKAKALLLDNRSQLKSLVLDLDAHLHKSPEIKRRAEDVTLLPLTSAQKRLFLLDQIQGESANYNMVATFKVHGKINLLQVEQAMNIVIARHEILRTVYRHEAGEPYQHVLPIEQIRFSVSIQDLKSLKAEKQYKTAMNIVEREVSYHFDLSKDLMVRVSYVALTEDSGLLTFIVHHIASDGWSQELLTKEFVNIYHALTLGEDVPQQVSNIQYGDYALWLDTVASCAHESQLDYWKQKLADAPTTHSVPLSYPRPAKSKHKGDTVNGRLSASHVAQLKEIAKTYRLTPFALIHGLFALLLSRYSRTNDILIGTAVAGRTQPQLNEMLGFFINMIALRVNTHYDSLLDYLEHVREVNTEALTNQDVAFERVVEALGLSGTQGNSPLFQILLTLDAQFTDKPIDMLSIDFSGLTFSPLEAPVVQAKYDLHLDCQLHDAYGVLYWTYDVGLFAQADIESMNSHFLNLLKQVAENGIDQYTHPASLPITRRDVKQSILPDPEIAPFAVPFDALVHHEIETRTSEAPRRIAVKMGRQQLTYQELDEQANNLAAMLQKQYDIAEGSLVGILSDRSLEMVIAMVAILKAGGAYVPLDPDYPNVRLRQMTEAVQLVLCQSKVVEQAEKLKLNACSINTLLQSAEREGYVNLEAGSLGKQSPLAYVIFTSGTTGFPKGVMVEHMGLLNTLKHCQSAFSITSDTVLYQATSLGFDAATWMIMLALTSGATVRLAKGMDFTEELLETDDVTHVFMTPSMLGTLDVSALGRIQMVISGGERCHAEIAKQWLSAGKVFINAYGPTEASICSSSSELSLNSAIGIGRPNTNMRYYILDEYLQPVPRGGLGELYIAGPGVARGYLGKAEASRAVFLDDPFEMDAEQYNKRMYKTGDLVRIDAHGDVIFMGRCDKQVKLRGFRIELQEIESSITAHEQVENAIVRMLEDQSQKRLVAYLVGSMDKSRVQSILREFLTQRLPSYMVPDQFIMLREIPLTRNGKVDFKKLPIAKNLGSHTTVSRPRTEQQLLVSQAVTDVLGVVDVGCDDNFFALGGNSLLAMKLIHSINERSKVKLTLEDLFVANNIRELAAQLDVQALKYQDEIKIASHKKDYPLSYAQQGIFVEYQMGNGSAYNVPLLLQFNGELDLSLFNEALAQLIKTHTALRLKIALQRGEPRQIVLKEEQSVAAIEVEIDNAASLDERNWLKEVNQHTSKILSQPLRITQGEMLNCYYYEHAQGMQIVLLNFSHIVVDGWSLEIIKKDLQSSYESLKHGEKLDKKKQALDFIDYVCWQQNNDQRDSGSAIDYWRRKLSLLEGIKPPPANFEATSKQPIEAESIHFVISSEIQQDIAQLASIHRCTEFNIWLMIYALAYSLQEKNNRLAVNVDFANRQLPGTDELVGMLVNSILVITEFNHDARLDQLLEQVVTTCNSAFSFGATALKPIVNRHFNAQSQRFEQIMRHKFAFSGGGSSVSEQHILNTQELEVDFSGLKYDWSVMLTASAEALNGRVMFNRHVYTQASADKFIAIFSFVAEQVAQNSEQTYENLARRWRETLSQRMKSKMSDSRIKRKFR